MPHHERKKQDGGGKPGQTGTLRREQRERLEEVITDETKHSPQK
jgi:hypothetical protein